MSPGSGVGEGVTVTVLVGVGEGVGVGVDVGVAVGVAVFVGMAVSGAGAILLVMVGLENRVPSRFRMEIRISHHAARRPAAPVAGVCDGSSFEVSIPKP